MNQCFVVGIFNLRGRCSLFSFHNGEEMVLWRTAVQQWIEVKGRTKNPAGDVELPAGFSVV